MIGIIACLVVGAGAVVKYCASIPCEECEEKAQEAFEADCVGAMFLFGIFGRIAWNILIISLMLNFFQHDHCGSEDSPAYLFYALVSKMKINMHPIMHIISIIGFFCMDRFMLKIFRTPVKGERE